MRQQYIDDMVRRLNPVLKDRARAKTILTKYWRDKMSLVWDVKNVHRAANEREVALTNAEAIAVLQTLHNHHNPQYGIKWEDLTAHIQDRVLGRKLRKTEIKRFVEQDIITVQKHKP